MADDTLRRQLLETALAAATRIDVVEDGTNGTPRWMLTGDGWELLAYVPLARD